MAAWARLCTRLRAPWRRYARNTCARDVCARLQIRSAAVVRRSRHNRARCCVEPRARERVEKPKATMTRRRERENVLMNEVDYRHRAAMGA